MKRRLNALEPNPTLMTTVMLIHRRRMSTPKMTHVPIARNAVNAKAGRQASKKELPAQ